MKYFRTSKLAKMSLRALRVTVLLVSLFCAITFCNGDGGDSDGGGTSGGTSGGGTSNFTVTYTDTTDITNWEWAVDWYVENADGSVRGPYDSSGTGVVDLGQDTRSNANATFKMASFHYTFMDLPVEHHMYDTDEETWGTLNVTLQNAVVGDEMSLAYATGFWATIDQDPFTFAQTLFSTDITGNDGNANVFVSYRASSADEPLTRYGFMLDFPVSSIGNVTLDVNTFATRLSREWISTEDLRGDEPFVMAQRKGLIMTPVGGSTIDLSGTQGTFGLPDQLPADRWYLASGSIIPLPDVVAEFDPTDPSPVMLVPFDRSIDENSMTVNSVDGTFTVTLSAGIDPIDFGKLRLSFSSHGSLWEIYFPGSALQFTGNTGVLQLPALPGYTSLPSFDSTITCELYRLDGTATPDSMLRWHLDQKGHPLPSFAMTSETKM